VICPAQTGYLRVGSLTPGSLTHRDRGTLQGVLEVAADRGRQIGESHSSATSDQALATHATIFSLESIQ